MASHTQRTVVVSLVAAAVGVRVAASDTVHDTATAVAADPGHALATAFDGWSTSGSLGLATAEGLRNLPLAVFYRAGELAGLSVEVLQPGWRALVLVIAVIGAVRLARATAGAPGGGRDSWTPWVAAALYACGPVLVATTTTTPLDGLAAATAPWVLTPLVSRSSGWVPAARSASWLGLAGFGSPAWAASVLLAGVIAAAPRRRSDVPQFGRWTILAMLSSAWWAASAMWEVVYARDVSGLVAPQGWGDALATAINWPDLSLPVVVLVAVGPAAVVLTALLLRAPGVDRVLAVGLLTVAVVGGATALANLWTPELYAHEGAWTPAPVLAPFLGLLALAALVSWSPLVEHVAVLWGGSPTHPPADSRSAVAAVAAMLVVVTASVAGVLTAGQERPADQNREQHPLESQLRAWSSSAGAGRALVLPPVDDPRDTDLFATSLQERPWVSRTSLPLSGAGGTAALDHVIARLQRGHGSAGTAEGLRRLGISYVILHGGPASDEAGADRNALTRAALVDIGGRRISVIGALAEDDLLRDFGLRPPTDQLEIWSVPESSESWVYDGAPLDVKGDVGAVTDLEDAGLLGRRPTRLWTAEDSDVAGVVSDSARRRNVDQRVIQDPVGPTLAARQRRTVVPPDAAPRQTSVRRVQGARAVAASSSAADLGGEDRRVGSHPMAAVDGNQFTAWESRRGTGIGEWWEIRFRRPTDVTGASVVFVNDIFRGHTVERVQLDTDRSSVVRQVSPGQPLALELPEKTRRLRISVTAVSRPTSSRDTVGIAELAVPNLAVQDSLSVTGTGAAAWVLSTLPGSYRNCVPAAGTDDSASTSLTACDSGLSVPGFESGTLHRVLRVDRPTRTTGRAWVRAAQSDAAADLADLLAQPSVRATASSVVSPDLSTRPQAAADGDPATAWRPSPEEETPSLSLEWDEATEVRGVDLDATSDPLASVPLEVRVTMDGALPVTVPVRDDGTIVVPPTRTRSLTVTFVDDSDLESIDSSTGGIRQVPIAVAEVRILGGPAVSSEMDRLHEIECGSGPTLSVGGTQVPTTLSISARDVVDGRIVQARACSEVDLPAGEVQVELPASFRWNPLGVALSAADSVLGRADMATPVPGTRARVATSALAEPRRAHSVEVPDSTEPGTLVISTPAGTGWTAQTQGDELEPIVLDGWAQAWVVPPGTEHVDLSYSPGVLLRSGAGLGAVALLAVVLLAVLGRSSRRSDAEPEA